MQITVTPEQIKIIVEISRALCQNPEYYLEDAIGWRKNLSKNTDVIFDLKDEEVVVDSSPGMHLSYFTSTYQELAGIALLNDVSFTDTVWDNNEPRTNDNEHCTEDT